MAVDPPSRRGFILNACHGDETLSDEALRLLQEVTSIGPDDFTRAAQARLHSALRALVEGSSADTPSDDFADTPFDNFAGTPRFTVIRRLGAGGFGTVYEAFDRQENRPVAIKVLRRLEFLERFKREFRALADLRHEALVPLYELFAEPNWFFTMELVRGVDLLEYVAPRVSDSSARTTCDVIRLRSAATQLAAGIRALHAKGILHRDIKPSNILVTADGRVQLLDFGLIWEAERSAIDSAIWAGTPGYLAPELLAQFPATPASDWYSFGVVLYRCIVGTLPTAEVLRQLAESSSAEAWFPEDAPDDLRKLCGSLLHPDPAKRPSEIEINERLGTTALVPRRAAMQNVSTHPIGRDSHLKRLNELFSDVCGGRTIVANVHGNSGVGKTTLLRAFARSVQPEFNAVFLSGRCHQNETIPYKALDDLVDGLARYLKTLRGADVESFTPHDVTYLDRLFPALARVEGLHHVRRTAIEVIDVQEVRERAFSSLRDLLMRLSEKRVVVITLDDLQWGDLDSAAFLNKLLVDGASPSLLFIASYRSEEQDTSPFLQQWRSSLATAPGVIVADLFVEPLDHVDAGRVAAELLGAAGEAKADWAATIAVESGGSPFLIDQMARHMTVEGLHAITTLTDVISQQVSHLPADVQRLLGVISIAGEPIPFAVVNVAAGLERQSIAQLSHLTSERLIRIRDVRGTKEVEPYHHRIGETIAASLEPDRRREHHLALANALRREEYPNAALLATHFRSGGDLDSATLWSLTAADQSMQALAFDRASHWYEVALDLKTLTLDQEVAVRGQLAHALVHAGHGTRAAATYLQAADDASTTTERFEFKRLAAEQLLRSGLVTRGLELLQTVAREAGVWLPKHRWQMIASILWHRSRVKLRGLRFRIRSRDEIAPADIVTLDIYWSLVIGFATLDSTRSQEFQSRHLLLALRVGDADRIAIALAAEAAFNASFKGRDVRVIAGLFERARQLSQGTTHPQAAGVVAVFEALATLISGEFRTAQRLSEEARSVLRERCSGAMWESATAALVHAGASLHLGDWHKLEEPAKILNRMSDAVEERNAYEVYAVSTGMHISTLIRDRIDVGRAIGERLAASLVSSPQDQYLLPQLWLLEGYADFALYQEDPARAWGLVERDWPAFSRSSHHWLEFAAICAYYLRGRTAIAMAAVVEQPRVYRNHAERCLRLLDRHQVVWARAFAAMVRAGLASLSADSQMPQLLEAAEEQSSDSSMAHCVAACRYRRGVLLGGTVGERLVADARRWAQEQDIVHPSRMFDVFLPGRWE